MKAAACDAVLSANLRLDRSAGSRRTRLCLSFTFLSLAAACNDAPTISDEPLAPGATQPEVAEPTATASGANAMASPEIVPQSTTGLATTGGGGGAGGAAECSDDAPCVQRAAALARFIANPTQLERPTLSSRCVWGQLGSGEAESFELVLTDQNASSQPICLCSWSAANPNTSYTAIGASTSRCFATSRAHQCVFSSSQFSGCDVAHADTSCADDCAAYDAARQADAEAHYDVEILQAICENSGCRNLTRVGSACYVDGRDTPYDCALGPDEIRRRENAALSAASSATALPFPISTVPPVGSDPRRWTRPTDEWQGMLPLTWAVPACTTSTSCGMARACVDALCVPCIEDRECAAGEVCALGNCVLTSNASCRSRHDCASDALCILSGYTGNDPRANSDMRAYCLSPNGGTAVGQD